MGSSGFRCLELTGGSAGSQTLSLLPSCEQPPAVIAEAPRPQLGPSLPGQLSFRAPVGLAEASVETASEFSFSLCPGLFFLPLQVLLPKELPTKCPAFKFLPQNLFPRELVPEEG